MASRIVPIQSSPACPRCGGGLPFDTEEDVCQCGVQFAAPQPRWSSLSRRPKQCSVDECVWRAVSKGMCAGHAVRKRTCTAGECDRPANSKGKCRIHDERAKSKEVPRRGRSRAGESIPASARAAVIVRCVGLCEACGDPLPASGVHLHHRLLRSQGGDHTPGNLVALHGDCHVVAPQSVHQRPAWARERGLMLRRGYEALTVPLTLPTGQQVLLDASGLYVPLSAILA